MYSHGPGCSVAEYSVYSTSLFLRLKSRLHDTKGGRERCHAFADPLIECESSEVDPFRGHPFKGAF